LLFLLMQITISSLDCPHGAGVSNPWTEYVKMLPSTVPVPTMWTDDLCQMLMGTSLEVGCMIPFYFYVRITTKAAAKRIRTL
jgi:hypothetical protein